VGNDTEAVLVDAGISCRETEVRMKRLGLSLKKVKAIFITHEHSDHIYGVATLSKKYQIPVYITEETKRSGRVSVKPHLQYSFNAYQTIFVGALSVTPIPKTHDAIDPYSFMIASDTVRVGVFTDIGFACEHTINQFQQCHAVFLESNYDEEMLEKGRYTPMLKERIRGGRGHISNKEALQLFLKYKPGFMSHLILSHLSAENNTQKIVRELFNAVAGDTKIIIASRSKESPIYHIRSAWRKQHNKNVVEEQLSLF
jgi:phosphoribosyl 1,2-cyclic phosphodiesterase